MVIDDVVAAWGLFEVLQNFWTGVFVVVDVLHISPHLPGRLLQRPRWLKCAVGGGARELRDSQGEEARQIWRGLLLLGCVRERK